jgi:RNA polymerase sigma factor (sigma-70 family)
MSGWGSRARRGSKRKEHRPLARWLDAAAEAALVQGLRDRNQDAAAELVQLCLPELLGTARQSGLQDQDAYAVALETLERSMRAIGSFTPRPGATLRSWLFRILFNCIKSAARKEKRLRAHEITGMEFGDGEVDPDTELSEGELAAAPAGPTPVAESRLSAPAALGAVTTALLDRMTPRERDVMIRQGDGMSDDQIAADLGVKVGAVRTARARARKHATDALKEIAQTLDETIQRRFRKLLN